MLLSTNGPDPSERPVPPDAPDSGADGTPAPESVPPGVPFADPVHNMPTGPSEPDLAGELDLAADAPLGPPPPLPASAYPEPPVGSYTGPVASDHPAYDRVQTRDPEDLPQSSRRFFVGAVALVLVGIAGAFYFLRPSEGAAATDLLTTLAAHATDAQPSMRTSDLDEAEAFIIGEFGWPIRVPVLPNTRLEGVGIEALADNIEVPVLFYAQEGGGRLPVFAYDYAFLDEAQDYLTLVAPAYARLAEEPGVDVRRLGDAYLVMWRRRAAIYTAVVNDDPAPLVEYLRRR